MGDAAAATVGIAEAEGGTAAPGQILCLAALAPANTEAPTRVREAAGTGHRAAERIAAIGAKVRRLAQSLLMRTHTGGARDCMAMNGH
jgi:hypothetical protein